MMPALPPAPESASDAQFGKARTASEKERETGKKLRASEYDHERGIYKIHRERIALPGTGEVDEPTRAALEQALAFLKDEVDRYLAANGKESCEGISREELTKAINPFKWIVAEDTQIMLGKSKLAPADEPNGKPEKMGHITLVGGSAEPRGRIGGLLYCVKHANGEYEFCLDNDSGRFGTGEDRNPAHLKNVANRFNDIRLRFEGREVAVRDVWLDMPAITGTASVK